MNKVSKRSTKKWTKIFWDWGKHEKFYFYLIPVSFASTCPLVSFEKIDSSLSFNFDAVCDCNSVPMLHTSGRPIKYQVQ